MMRIRVEAGHVHGEADVDETFSVSETDYDEEGWETCADQIALALLRAQEMMHPSKATWVTVEWTWSPL